MDELLTVDEVAERFKLPRSWVYERTRRRTSDGLPFIKLGKYIRFLETDVRTYLERQRHAQSSTTRIE
jgi:excisionase family DNA binding protein